MKQGTFLFTIIFFSIFSLANEKVKLDLDLYLNGKHISSPQIFTKLGEKSFISQKQQNGRETLMEVQTKKHKKGLHMKFIISEVIGGKPELVSSSEIITTNKKTAELRLSDENQEETLRLKITPEIIQPTKL